jgi:hypothetical protein
MTFKALLCFLPPCVAWATLSLLPSSASSQAPTGTTSRPSPAQAPEPLSATKRIYVQIPHQSFETYARRADAIAYAVILEQAPEFIEGDLLYTRVTAGVTYALKGELPATVTFRVPGGRFLDQRVLCDAAPNFELGQETVLFLQQGADGASWGLLGLSQGAYRVQPSTSGEPVLSGLHAQDQTLSAFEARISEANR